MNSLGWSSSFNHQVFLLYNILNSNMFIYQPQMNNFKNFCCTHVFWAQIDWLNAFKSDSVPISISISTYQQICQLPLPLGRWACVACVFSTSPNVIELSCLRLCYIILFVVDVMRKQQYEGRPTPRATYSLFCAEIIGVPFLLIISTYLHPSSVCCTLPNSWINIVRLHLGVRMNIQPSPTIRTRALI